MGRFGQMQYATIREMLFFIDKDMPDYTNRIAMQYNIKIQKISHLAHMLTSDDNTFIVEMYKLSPDDIPIIINMNKKYLDRMIKREDGIVDDKARNSEILSLTKLIKETMEKGE